MFGYLDNHRMEKECLDFYAYDSYPNFAFCLGSDPKNENSLNDRFPSMLLNEVRSICPHFGVMEQQSGANGWTTKMEAPAPRPGQLTLWAMQSVAHGADFVSFFRWRTCTIGTEIYWHGILDYDNRDNRKLAEVKDFYKKLKAVDAVCGAEYAASFAILKDYDNEWDAEVDAWHKRVAKPSEVEIFRASEMYHTPYDVIYMQDDSEISDLTKYPVIFYPHPTIMNEERVALLKSYVNQGGCLIIGCRSGYKDMNGHCVMMPQPGLLQELTGSDVKDFTFVSPAEDDVFADASGKKISMNIFNDILAPVGDAKVIATYSDSYYAKEPAVIENNYGKGKVIHLGSTFSFDNVSWLFDYTGIKEPFSEYICVPESLEITVRKKDGRLYLFVLNYKADEAEYELKKEAKNMYTGNTVSGVCHIEPYGTAVYELD